MGLALVRGYANRRRVCALCLAAHSIDTSANSLIHRLVQIAERGLEHIAHHNCVEGGDVGVDDHGLVVTQDKAVEHLEAPSLDVLGHDQLGVE